jgi:hypothetical protein
MMPTGMCAMAIGEIMFLVLILTLFIIFNISFRSKINKKKQKALKI